MACRSSTSHRDGDAGPYRRGRSRKPALSGPGSAGTPPRLVQSVSAMPRCRCRRWMALMVGLARPMYGVPIFERRLDQARSLRQVSPVVALSFLLRLVRSALDLLGVHRLSGLENTSRSSCSATRSKSCSETRHAASSPGADRLGAFVAVSYTHLRAHETASYLVCRLLLEKKK